MLFLPARPIISQAWLYPRYSKGSPIIKPQSILVGMFG